MTGAGSLRLMDMFTRNLPEMKAVKRVLDNDDSKTVTNYAALCRKMTKSLSKTANAKKKRNDDEIKWKKDTAVTDLNPKDLSQICHMMEGELTGDVNRD